MSLFGKEITKEQAVEAHMMAQELQTLSVRTPEQEKALQAATKLVASYQKQMEDMEANLRLGLKAALKLFKTFLPSRISNQIPDNAVEMIFGLLQKPEIILDYCNKQWQDFCDSCEIPAECIRVLQQKPGRTADLEGVILVYNPQLGYWVPTEFKTRDLLEKIRPGGVASDNVLNIKPRLKQLYRATSDSEIKALN